MGYFIIAFLILCLVMLIVVLVSNSIIKKNVITITSDKIDKDIDIVFISDIHVGLNCRKKSLKKIINLVNEFDGDYLLIGGDMVGYNPLSFYKDDELKKLINEFKIKNRYFVKGNHDDCSLLMYDNFKILNDESVNLSDNVVLTGLNWDKGENLDYTLKLDKFNILFSHYPDRVVEYSNVDLALGAHSHGNQINLPFCKFHHKEKYTRGLYNFSNGTKLYVNKGLGFSFLKIRVFSVREVVKIELRRGEKSGNC